MFHLAINELRLSPLNVFMCFATIGAITTTLGLILIVGEAFKDGIDLSIVSQPAVVIKKTDNTPLKIDEALPKIKRIPGVLGAWPRIHDTNVTMKAGYANDIALHVFHPAEARAMEKELRYALPWSADILMREDRSAIAKSFVSRRTTLWLALHLPALLGLLLVLSLLLRSGMADHYAIGIQKAVGWTSKEILRYHFTKTALLAIPPTILGMCTSAFLTFFANITSSSALFLGMRQSTYALTLSPFDVVKSTASAAALVLIPIICTTLVPVVRGLLTDPGELLVRGPS